MRMHSMSARAAVAAVMVLALAIGCAGKRYVDGTTPQQAAAYELDQAMTHVRAAQVSVIAAVDDDPSLKPSADKFLNPVRDLFKFTGEQLVPKLEAYDAAVKMADDVKRLSLETEIRPLLQKFERDVLAAFGVSLPTTLSERVSTFVDTVRDAVRVLKDRFNL